MKIIIILISTIFVNNVILAQFLGICPFLGTSKKTSTAVGMGAAVIFVLVLATLVTYLLNKYVLVAHGLQFLQTIAFILVIAALVQMVEIILKKISPSLYTALGVFLPLITTNCCVLGVSLKVVGEGFIYGNNVGEAVIYAAGIAIGFAVALIIFSGIREHIDLMEAPEGTKGTPIALITAGILAMAFMGFGGLV
ncbi:MAG: RnfABCDGE type electron transport complex subunit A [Bacteroidales bacterium]|jgi:electron transport complex protein RnfA|nr:RnfABCDGE type electron transport complex subunit A [Bacteroidales bacterium]MBO7528583.1 RnfABCDGE type electron transport complex subunit A [Bacteroidales bacterium]MBQ3844533.1 RnfABCDGE type electron transport complex subunit A [Bacteroidales bacterium]